MSEYQTVIQRALLGKTITGFTLSPTGERIIFELANSSPVILVAEGDCCSTSWIEHVDAPDCLIGTVNAVNEIDMPNLGNIDGQRHTGVDVVSYYGLKITTEKGICVLDYRNDSNGYYGGSLEVLGS